ncbi:hypothetical protein, partial [Staphylococcus aureus]|uniref:hypothetical protein n=1 Tax=Staphylococcus aureus TaxID=1280 RepID=UPI00210ED8B5
QLFRFIALIRPIGIARMNSTSSANTATIIVIGILSPTALEGQEIEEIKAKKEELEKVIQELSAKVYEQAAQQQQQAQGANAGQNNYTLC